MKTTARILATTALVVQGIASLTAQDAPPQADFSQKLTRDAAPLPNGGQMMMSYANVAEKILPSVVTIFNYSSAPSREMTADRIPPQMREHLFRYFFGVPGAPDDFGMEEEEEAEEEQPRRGSPFDYFRRRNPRQEPQEQQKPAPKQKTPERRNGVGSGVIVTADGYILTNNHVIEDATRIEVVVTTGDTSKSYNAEVIGTDPATDVAVIKIEAAGLVPATVGDSAKLRVGDIVLAAGAPMELSRSISQGIVSAMGRSRAGIIGNQRPDGSSDGYEDFIQTDAAINPGNSGGPLVDGLGRVVGINTAILTKSGMNGGIGFAIPINMALRIGEDLLDDGEVARGYLGIQIQDITEEIAKQYKVEQNSGAIIGYVTPDSPAEKAGMRLEDIVVAINGQKVDDSSRLRLIVSAMKPGSSVAVDLLRDSQRMTINAVLERLPEEALAGGTPRPGVKPKAPGKPVDDNAPVELVRGVSVQTLTPALRQRHDVAANVEGVIVIKVEQNSRAAAMGLEEGDVITQINRQPVAKSTDARKIAEAGDPSMLLRLVRKGGMMLLMINNE